MGLLKNLFLEEVQEAPILTDEEMYLEDEVEVNTELVSQDNLIEDIYNQNALSDLSKSIFKVEQTINSLPKEMPNDTKKATVLTILSNFGLTVDEIVEDGYSRQTIIRSALNAIVEENESAISTNKTIIEQKKMEIQELEKDNANRESVIKNTEDKIELELKRISDLVTFIGGEK